MSSKLLIPYQNKWVALNQDKTKVVDYDKDLKLLAQKLKKRKKTNVIFMHVMNMTTRYSL